MNVLAEWEFWVIPQICCLMSVRAYSAAQLFSCPGSYVTVSILLIRV